MLGELRGVRAILTAVAGTVPVAALLTATLACTGGGAGAGERTHDVARGRLDTFVIDMPELESRRRTIRVHLPAGYEATGASYPVLYLQDAQNLFTPGPYGDWLVDETIDELVRTGRMAGVIIVGVDNSTHRWSEYGPWVNTTMHRWVDDSWARAVEGGDGAAYLDFMVNTLKPEIDRRYRTQRGPESTGIGGASMGGIIAVYAGITRPDVFSKVMAMSPAVWFGEHDRVWLSHNQLLAELQSRPLPTDVRFWIDVGTDERSRDADPHVVDSAGASVSYPRAYEEGARVLAERLIARGVPPPHVALTVDSGASHHEAAWAARLPDALLWLYGETPR